MGGDDLASDDEYLADSGLAYASSSDGEDDGAQATTEPAPNAKRKGTTTTSTGDDDPPGSELPPSKKNRKRNAAPPTSSQDILLLAGRGIAMDGPDAQATFLGALYSHSIRLSGGGAGGASAATASASGGSGGDGPGEEAGDGGRRKSSDDDDDDDDDDDAPSSSFSFLPHLHVASPDGGGGATGDAKARRQCRHSDLGAFLKSGGLLPSNKRLKNWKHPRSPMVLVVTLSARRSVELMRQLSSLKLPVAKLFAKHMSVEDQVGLLRGYGGGKSTSSSSSSGRVGGGGVGGEKRGGGGGKYYSLAVGTPGRLLKLLRHSGRDDDEGGGGGADAAGMGALRLNHTEVVIIDCHEDSKGWNVCTLNDTSKELMEFVKQGVIPQLDKRKGKIKLAMF